ncbi:biotin--[acetyl-CoA-carboxylase] ligase [Helicobacter bilis]|uniref:Biotin--[acetyl-CoA-carboxylase] ligase n=2 Tax=Helicobacter bilis TaxID=37372 RepID=A0A6D2C8D8_9HELI|nr:biotin--[acetyl-CoA-carboxylase] ligase [Helicobacter bilis]EMZ37516.1 biotin-[acetyl-CoA-carboxylase] ligase [Helicobacter bilis WiWa]TLE03842.1 biotin--[acetyl-CoA-carboxylase] ligase [Helicobacter bilis]TLE04608.1 biotin--[acetyl-CoA-carboxylase] ligase [Helicobacter bilis]
MRFIWTQEMPSTQVWLSDYIRKNDLESICIVATKNQTSGIGSRANTWDKVSCGLYLSCALPIALLPKDLTRQSSSIYFGQILLELFREFHKDLWLKWPNDFYLQDDKIGGLITQYVKGFAVFGIGLNIFSEEKSSLLTGKMQNNLSQKDSIESISIEILSQIIKKILHFLSFNIVEFALQKNIDTTLHGITCNAFLQNNMTWYEVFNRYKQGFSKNHRFYTHINEDGITHKVSLQDALLQNDGSIVLHDKILYSLR